MNRDSSGRAVRTGGGKGGEEERLLVSDGERKWDSNEPKSCQLIGSECACITRLHQTVNCSTWLNPFSGHLSSPPPRPLLHSSIPG